jgi:hypothetical protein
MLRKVSVGVLAITLAAAFLFVSKPADAGSCSVLSEKAVGLKKSDTSSRALKQLNRKASHWAKKNGYKKVSVSKAVTACSKKGALYHCTAAAKACGR